MTPIAQQRRLLQVNTPLGEDILILTEFSGTEEVSKLFEFNLEMFSTNLQIAPKEIIGKAISVQVNGQTEPVRFFHGIVKSFYIGELTMRNQRVYRAQIIPWFGFLRYSSDCRIFQNQSVKAIVDAVFQKAGYSDYSMSDLQGGTTIRNYCTQYCESTFDFVSRLLEEEGISYYFKHEKEKHTLVLTDKATGFKTNTVKAVYQLASAIDASISKWQECYNFGLGKWTKTSYDFERPTADLKKSSDTITDLSNINKYEYYEYSGRYDAAFENDQQAKLLIETDECQYQIIEGTSNYANFAAGTQFTLTKNETEVSNKDYILLSVYHKISDVSSVFNDPDPTHYENNFLCIPATARFHPQRTTPKPKVFGIQTAEVVGPDGEEIYCDKYGRIKVRFYWDRDTDKKKEESSCWIRVAQTWAGKNWGNIFTPRVGQEVIISFLEGDPDQPLIVGSVYNANLMPPYALPDNATQSGIKTRSSKQGGEEESNELRFEDKKGEELVYMHAQKDLKSLIEHDEQREIKNNQELKIQKDRTITVEEGNESITIKKGNQTIVIETGDEEHTIKTGNRTVKINTGNDTLEIQQGNQSTKISAGSSSLEAMQGIELKVGGNSIKIDQAGITIKGMKVEINGTLIEVKADASLKLEAAIIEGNGSGMLKLQGAVTMIN